MSYFDQQKAVGPLEVDPSQTTDATNPDTTSNRLQVTVNWNNSNSSGKDGDASSNRDPNTSPALWSKSTPSVVQYFRTRFSRQNRQATHPADHTPSAAAAHTAAAWRNHVPADIEELESTYRILPLIIGCIVPVSILINVPSLTSPWVGSREYNPLTGSWGEQVTEVPLPQWITAMVIIALIMAVICNLCVLSRFLERHIFHSVVLSLITASLQDVLSIGAIVPFCLRYRPSQGYVYLEGFWTMIASMIFSLTATILMSIDLYRTPHFRLHGSGVTHKQRMLIAQAMTLCLYLAIGALAFIWIEKWSFLQALFFVMVTITTIGFGDNVPKTGAGRAFVIFYGAGGIILFAMVVNAIRYVILEDLHRQFALRAKERKSKRDTRRRERREQRIQEKERRKRVKEALARIEQMQLMNGTDGSSVLDGSHGNHQSSHHFSILPKHFTMPHGRIPALFMRHSTTDSSTESKDGGGEFSDSTFVIESSSGDGRAKKKEKKQQEKLLLETLMQAESGEKDKLTRDEVGSSKVSILDDKNQDAGPPYDSLTTWHTHPGLIGISFDLVCLFYRLLGRFFGLQRAKCANIAAPCKTLREQREADKKLAYQESMEEYRRRLRFSFTMFMSFWLAGAGMFKLIETWSYGEAFYFSFVAFSSIGYGDVVPLTLAGRSIFLAYCLVGVVTLTSLASLISEVLSKTMRRHVVETQLRRSERFIEHEGRGAAESGQRRASDTDLEHGDMYGEGEGDDGENGFSSDDGLQEERMQTLHSLISPAAAPTDETLGDDASKQRVCQGSLRNLVQVSRDFDTLLQKVLGLDYLQAGDDCSPTSACHFTTLPDASSASAAQTIMDYLEKEDDDDSSYLSPSLSRDITSTSSIHRQSVASLGQSFSNLRSGNTYHGSGYSSSSSDSQFNITAWPSNPLAQGAAVKPLAAADKAKIRHSLHPNDHYQQHLTPRLHPKHQKQPAPHHGHHPSDQRHHSTGAQQTTPSPVSSHRHNMDGSVTIGAVHWQQLIEYSTLFRTLTDSCDETLKRLLAWEACEKKMCQRRRQAKERQKRILQERRRRLFELGGTYGAIDDEIEDEDELEEDLDDWDEEGTVGEEPEQSHYQDEDDDSIEVAGAAENVENDETLDQHREGIANALLGTVRPTASRRNHGNGRTAHRSVNQQSRMSAVQRTSTQDVVMDSTSADDSSATAVSSGPSRSSRTPHVRNDALAERNARTRSLSRTRERSKATTEGPDVHSRSTQSGAHAQRPPLHTIHTNMVPSHFSEEASSPAYTTDIAEAAVRLSSADIEGGAKSQVPTIGIHPPQTP